MNDRKPQVLPDAPPSVRRVEQIISSLLRVGVLVSIGTIVMGTVISFLHHPGYLWSSKDLSVLTMPGKAEPNSLNSVIAGMLSGRGQALVMVGLLLLIATPVLRVAVSIIAFMLQRDWVYTLITATVLGLLLLSLVLGRSG